MTVDTQKSDSLKEVSASEILDKIKKGEPIVYNHCLIKNDIDISNLNLKKENKKFLITSKIKITNSQIEGNTKFYETIFKEEINFKKTSFIGYADFEEALFSGDANFKEVTFSGGADFWWALFNGDANFEEASFNGFAKFRRASFNGFANFWKALFSEGADFWWASFISDADFREASFSGHANFRSASFNRNAHFREISFSKDADFRSVSFNGFTHFREASFGRFTSFEKTSFSKFASFGNASFSRNADFKDASFAEDADFRVALFSRDAYFEEPSFDGDVDFKEASFDGDADFKGASFGRDADFRSASFNGFADFKEASFCSSTFFNGSQFKGDDLTFRSAIFKNLISQEEACRKAKNLLEKNGNREEAGYHFYREMEAIRKQKESYYSYFDYEALLFITDANDASPKKLTDLFRYLRYNILEYLFIQVIFGYGVHPLRLWSCWWIIVGLFALIYWMGSGINNSTPNQPLNFFDYMWFSITVAVTPGFAGYKPTPGFYQVLAGLEAIFGTFMWAAFITTFAKKYMR
jgi:hypothetical protein